MPIYEYKCKKCGETFEILLRKRDEKVECPKCGDKNPEKLLSAFSANANPSKDCPSGGPCGQPAQHGHHCCGGGCGCH